MRIVLVMLALLAALPIQAVQIRADRDDDEYLELATHYPSALLAAAAVEGVVIAPRWILVSAHASPALKEAGAIQAIYRHPDADLALLFLREAVAHEPAPVRRNGDEMAKGIVLVGHGGDGRARAAINTVDRLGESTFGVRIKPLEDASDLQGAATDAERGAPAFIENGGRIEVAGLYTSTAAEWQTFVRLSHYASWIDDTMFRAAVEETRRR